MFFAATLAAGCKQGVVCVCRQFDCLSLVVFLSRALPASDEAAGFVLMTVSQE